MDDLPSKLFVSRSNQDEFYWEGRGGVSVPRHRSVAVSLMDHLCSHSITFSEQRESGSWVIACLLIDVPSPVLSIYIY